MAISPTDTIAASPNVVAREVGDETVLLDLDEGTYFGLNPVGGSIWAFLESGSRPVSAICEMIVSEYDVEADEAFEDVVALVETLLANKLVSKEPG